MDFISDALFDGRPFRLLTIVDCCSHEGLGTVPRANFRAFDVMKVVDRPQSSAAGRRRSASTTDRILLAGCSTSEPTQWRRARLLKAWNTNGQRVHRSVQRTDQGRMAQWKLVPMKKSAIGRLHLNIEANAAGGERSRPLFRLESVPGSALRASSDSGRWRRAGTRRGRRGALEAVVGRAAGYASGARTAFRPSFARAAKSYISTNLSRSTSRITTANLSYSRERWGPKSVLFS